MTAAEAKAITDAAVEAYHIETSELYSAQLEEIYTSISEAATNRKNSIAITITSGDAYHRISMLLRYKGFKVEPDRGLRGSYIFKIYW